MVQVLGSWISWYLQPRSSLTKMNQELNSLNNILELAIFLCPFSLKEPQDKKKKNRSCVSEKHAIPLGKILHCLDFSFGEKLDEVSEKLKG